MEKKKKKPAGKKAPAKKPATKKVVAKKPIVKKVTVKKPTVKKEVSWKKLSKDELAIKIASLSSSLRNREIPSKERENISEQVCAMESHMKTL
jgi:hypothetical protein